MHATTVKPQYNEPLGTAEKVHYIMQGVHYIRVFTTSGCSLYRGSFTLSIGVHSKVYVCYIREFIVSRIHYIVHEVNSTV